MSQKYDNLQGVKFGFVIMEIIILDDKMHDDLHGKNDKNVVEMGTNAFKSIKYGC